MQVSEAVHKLFAMAFGEFGQEYGEAERKKVMVVDGAATLVFDAADYEESTIAALVGSFTLTTSAADPKRLTISAKSSIAHGEISESSVMKYMRGI